MENPMRLLERERQEWKFSHAREILRADKIQEARQRGDWVRSKLYKAAMAMANWLTRIDVWIIRRRY